MRIFICTITCFLLSLSLSAQYRYSSRKEIKSTRSGYFNISEFGYAPAYDSFYNPGALTISTINGYKPSDHFSAGLGISYLRFNEGNQHISNFLPIFADIRAYFGRRTALMLVGDVGYGLLLDKVPGRKGDLYLNPAIGLRTYTSDHTALVFSVGYLSQFLLSDSYDGAYTSSSHTENISLKIGFLF